MANYVFIKDKLVTRAEHEAMPHTGEMFELESALKDLQKQRARLAVDFAESVISKSAKIKKLQALFNIPMERINLNERAMAALTDRCLGLFGCVAYRDGDKISIEFNDYLTCTACGASNDVGDIFCADCGQSFEQMRKKAKKEIEVYQARDRKLKQDLADAVLVEIEKNEALRSTLACEQLNMLEQNEAVQAELFAKINKLAESEASSKDNDDISGYKYIVCGKCGKRVDVGVDFCPDCGSSLAALDAKRICPSCKTLYMNETAFCMFCGTQTNEVKKKQKKNEEIKKTCSYCGAPIVAGRRFCTKCGARLEGAAN